MTATGAGAGGPALGAASDNWTVRLRNRLSHLVPPGEALPDRQPVYVSSWIYVFGVLTLAALFVVLLSGALLAVGGVAWWHTSSLGLYVNSTHLWSVELFFAFMVIHLWGKFWMAAWRGHRALTWVTGVVAFLASIGTAFTGYLSQSNFDAQWISAEAKDGLNSVGIGAWFNVLNPGQMLLWHVVLLPFVLGVLTVAHVVLVRRHGVVPPLDAGDSERHDHPDPRPAPQPRTPRPTPDSHSFPTRDYDLVKEFVIALLVVVLLTVGLAAVFSSPDEKAISLRDWATAAPADVVATATGELAGTTTSATYGAAVQQQRDGADPRPAPAAEVGRRAASRRPGPGPRPHPPGRREREPAAGGRAGRVEGRDETQRTAWATAYADALAKAPDGDPAKVPPGAYGPVPVLADSFLALTRSGGLEGTLTSAGTFYGGDQTRTLLLLSDGAYLEDQARARHLGGDQWGMMNETGNYPGQPWMWLYTFWYQIPPFSTSENADALVWGLMMVLSLALLLVPFIPGLRSIPRWVPVHRLVWRDYYRQHPRH